MNSMQLAWRMLLRDARSGELTLLILAMVLAAMALSSVSFLVDRVARAVQLEAHQLLGGDLLLSADHPWDDAFRSAAARHGLQIAESVKFRSMTRTDTALQLAEVKAVSAQYPLRGAMRTAGAIGGEDMVMTGERRAPPPGKVWPDADLAQRLDVAPPARIGLGAVELEVAAIVTHEPERGVNPFSIAPHLIMALADLPATELLSPGARVRWRLHLAGEADDVAAFRSWAQAHLGRGERIEGLQDARPQVRRVIERAQGFLRLAALLTVVLAAVAVGLAARRYMQCHLDGCAVMRCIGASGRRLLFIFGGEFVMLGLIASAGGCLLGYLAQHLLQGLAGDLLAVSLPPPGATPWLHGMAAGLLLAAGFAAPPLLRLRSASTLRVLRREWGEGANLPRLSWLPGVVGMTALAVWIGDDAHLAMTVLLGFIVAVALFVVAGRLLLAPLDGLLAHSLAGDWRMGLANVRRRSGATLVQAVALALGLTALLLLTASRDDMLQSWRRHIPPQAPNHFIVNIQPQQRAAVEAFFADLPSPPQLEPMVRARLMRINERAVAADDYDAQRARRLVEREFNLSSSSEPPAGNRIVAGQWRLDSDDGLVSLSVEEGLALSLGLQVGDSLEFVIAGEPWRGRITSLRSLEWDSMRVNFFIIAAPGSLADKPLSYITSVYLDAAAKSRLAELVRRFPNLTVLDVAALIDQVRGMLDGAARAVQAVFSFALVGGLAVLFAAIQAGADERRHELAVMRALGGRRRQLRRALAFEFALLGGLAGTLAGAAAAMLALLLGRSVLQLDYWPTPWLIPLGMIVGAALTVLFSFIALRGALGGAVGASLRKQAAW